MANPFLAEIKIMSFSFAPKGWALCTGQLMPINQNQALYSLLGTTYGGDGRQTFGLPDLQGRAPMHMGSGHTLGEKAGEQGHTLSIAELPTHVHTASASTTNASPTTGGAVVAANNMLGAANNLYTTPAASLTALLPAAVASAGMGQAHPNMQPYLTLTFCIALQGIFPSQN